MLLPLFPPIGFTIELVTNGSIHIAYLLTALGWNRGYPSTTKKEDQFLNLIRIFEIHIDIESKTEKIKKPFPKLRLANMRNYNLDDNGLLNKEMVLPALSMTCFLHSRVVQHSDVAECQVWR